MDSYEICRVCVEEANHVWPLFVACKKVPPDLTPASLIAECAGVTVTPNDGLPDLVCDGCLVAMVKAYTIRRKCISSDRKLRKILLRGNALVPPQAVKQPEEADETGQHTELGEDEPCSTEEQKSSVSDDDFCSETHDVDIEELKDALNDEHINEAYLMEYCKQQHVTSEDEHRFIAINVGTLPAASYKRNVITSAEIIKPRRSQDKHVATDDVDKKFVCTICPKRFKTRGNLKAHVLLHSDHKPFRCEQCGATFAKKHNYNLHMQRHTGARTHPCPVCEKLFVCAVNLKNHMLVHSTMKPFRCDYCEKEFSYRTDKIRHEATHTGEYRYECEKCGRKYARNTSVIKHMEKCIGRIMQKQYASKSRTANVEATEQ